jgi:hypothetical protein
MEKCAQEQEWTASKHVAGTRPSPRLAFHARRVIWGRFSAALTGALGNGQEIDRFQAGAAYQSPVDPGYMHQFTCVVGLY